MAKADPIAEKKNNTPIHIKVFFLPILLAGIPPNIAPNTVPHKAIPITTVPWKASDEFQSSCNFLSAPEITTVSKPKRNPAKEAIKDQTTILFIIKILKFEC